MPSLTDSVVIFVLALLLFGPKKLPVLARELGKWIGEFRRASNEFKMQMEEELRVSEQADRQKEIAAIEAAAPVAPWLDGVPTEDPEHPHLPRRDTFNEPETYSSPETYLASAASEDPYPAPVRYVEPRPIATSGELSIMPPSTGLPTPQTRSNLGPLIDSIPAVDEHKESSSDASETPHPSGTPHPSDTPHPSPNTTESAAHG